MHGLKKNGLYGFTTTVLISSKDVSVTSGGREQNSWPAVWRTWQFLMSVLLFPSLGGLWESRRGSTSVTCLCVCACTCPQARAGPWADLDIPQIPGTCYGKRLKWSWRMSCNWHLCRHPRVWGEGVDLGQKRAFHRLSAVPLLCEHTSLCLQ